MSHTKIDALTNGQIQAVKAQANTRGDTEAARICDIALTGDWVARRQVLKDINEAETGVRIPPPGLP